MVKIRRRSPCSLLWQPKEELLAEVFLGSAAPQSCLLPAAWCGLFLRGAPATCVTSRLGAKGAFWEGGEIWRNFTSYRWSGDGSPCPLPLTHSQREGAWPRRRAGCTAGCQALRSCLARPWHCCPRRVRVLLCAALPLLAGVFGAGQQQPQARSHLGAVRRLPGADRPAGGHCRRGLFPALREEVRGELRPLPGLHREGHPQPAVGWTVMPARGAEGLRTGTPPASCCVQAKSRAGFPLRAVPSLTRDMSAPSYLEPPCLNTSILGACVTGSLEETAFLSSAALWGAACLAGAPPQAALPVVPAPA